MIGLQWLDITTDVIKESADPKQGTGGLVTRIRKGTFTRLAGFPGHSFVTRYEILTHTREVPVKKEKAEVCMYTAIIFASVRIQIPYI